MSVVKITIRVSKFSMSVIDLTLYSYVTPSFYSLFSVTIISVSIFILDKTELLGRNINDLKQEF